jgi:hypothetical protein
MQQSLNFNKKTGVLKWKAGKIESFFIIKTVAIIEVKSLKIASF